MVLDLKIIDHVRVMLLLDPHPRDVIIGTDRVLDRTSFHRVIADADDAKTMTTIGQRRACELGFDPKVMKGKGHESLYRAVSFNQTGTKKDYHKIYEIGIKTFYIT
ncbi:hypothetical protein CTI12_AA438210 [Artemisia annua]|uniref:Uncharacterized protein n=1 Tax=Artemisia annua TaxID=35608 RepID=A0A2U1LYX9_ARTAN|nr:hypothetical protein CTI12_AA438210 [Artemisia annua]